MLMDFRLHLLTWNVVGRPPIEDLGITFGLKEPVDVSNLPDIYAIGLQEVSCKPHDVLADIIIEDPWDSAFRKILFKWDYIKLKQIRLQGMVLYLFAKREHLIHVRGVQTSYTRTGLKGMWGNKGGVSIRFSVYGCSICIVNSHLAAHDTEFQQRIDDYNTIIDNQKFVDPLTENIITHDYTFWIGDLNFRIDDYTAQEIEHLIKTQGHSQLLSKDQLRKAMKLGQAFSEFTESTPTFNPTYKYRIDGSEYDIQKRSPAWTDRILFRFTADAYEGATLGLQQLNYTSHDVLQQSDHKPVSASFLLQVFSKPTEKQVTFLPISDWKVHSDSVAWYSFSEGAEPSTWDWIGLYRANYSSTEDHICYIWAPVRPSSDSPPAASQRPWYRVVFADQALLIPGRYRLFYISSEFDNILGVSEAFEILPQD